MKFTLGYGRWTQVDICLYWCFFCLIDYQHVHLTMPIVTWLIHMVVVCFLIYIYGSFAILEHLNKKLHFILIHFSTNILDCSTRKKAVFFPLLTEEISLKRKKSAPRGVIRNPPNKAQYTNRKNTKSGCVLN